jgi:hypothetical protein
MRISQDMTNDRGKVAPFTVSDLRKYCIVMCSTIALNGLNENEIHRYGWSDVMRQSYARKIAPHNLDEDDLNVMELYRESRSRTLLRTLLKMNKNTVTIPTLEYFYDILFILNEMMCSELYHHKQFVCNPMRVEEEDIIVSSRASTLAGSPPEIRIDVYEEMKVGEITKTIDVYEDATKKKNRKTVTTPIMRKDVIREIAYGGMNYGNLGKAKTHESRYLSIIKDQRPQIMTFIRTIGSVVDLTKEKNTD